MHFPVQHCGAVPGTEAITTLLLEEPESYKNICCILTHQIKGVATTVYMAATHIRAIPV